MSPSLRVLTASDSPGVASANGSSRVITPNKPSPASDSVGTVMNATGADVDTATAGVGDTKAGTEHYSGSLLTASPNTATVLSPAFKMLFNSDGTAEADEVRPVLCQLLLTHWK
jgi:hypothetical protein